MFIIVINWNSLVDTLDCLAGIGALQYSNKRIVVVDNGSKDGSPDEIAARHPDVVLIRNQENLGYTGGSNVGLKHAFAHGAEYVWLLNNDAVVTPNSLTILTKAAEGRPRVGLVAPIVYYHDRPDEIQVGGTFLDAASQTDTYVKSREPNTGPGGTGRLVLTGTALLVARALVATIGYLEDRYFAYCEDWDYSLRAHEAGFGVLVEPAATVFHKPAGSLGHDSPMKEYYMVRNRYLLWRSHLRGWPRAVYPSRYLGWALERALNARSEGKEALAGAALDGVWDAYCGRFGSWRPTARMPRSLKYVLSRGLLAWHPYFWIMLLKGDLGAISVEAARRTLRKLT